MMSERLKDLFEQIAEHTRSLCSEGCPRTNVSRCCSEAYCMTTESNLRAQGISVPPRLPGKLFLIPGVGCVLPAWQRPICSVYHCQFSIFEPLGDHKEWAEKHFKLKNEISRMIREEGIALAL